MRSILVCLAAAVLFNGCAPTHLGLGYGLRRNDNLSAHARWEVSKDKGVVHGFTVRVWAEDDDGDAGAAITYGLRFGNRFGYRLGGGLTSRDVRLHEKTMCSEQGPWVRFGRNAAVLAHLSCIGDDAGLNWAVYEREIRRIEFPRKTTGARTVENGSVETGTSESTIDLEQRDPSEADTSQIERLRKQLSPARSLLFAGEPVLLDPARLEAGGSEAGRIDFGLRPP